MILPHFQPQALLFDIDGTLVDTMPVHFRAWTDALAAAGIEFVDFDEFVNFGGTTASKLVSQFAAGHDIDEQGEAAILADKTRRVQAALGETTPIAVAVELAENFRAQGGKIGLFTGGQPATIAKTMSLNGLEHLGSESLVTPADLPDGRGKPHPDGLFLVCEQLGVEPCKCLYVGDSPLDKQAAFAAGMAFLHVEGLSSAKVEELGSQPLEFAKSHLA